MEEKRCRALVVTGILERLLGIARSWFDEKILRWTVEWSKTIGHYALLAAAVVGIVVGLVGAIKMDSFYFFLGGVGWVLLLLVLQYIAYRFVGAGNALIDTSPSKLRTTAFLDCVALVGIIGGVILLVGGLISGIRAGDLRPVAVGIGSFVLVEYLACFALNPRILNVTVDERIGAGEDAIGILTFFMKGFLRILPIFYAVFVGLGTLGGVAALIKMIGSPGEGMALGFGSANLVIAGGVLPFTGYVTFVLYYLTIDVLRSILVLPAKLDALGAGESSAAPEPPQPESTELEPPVNEQSPSEAPTAESDEPGRGPADAEEEESGEPPHA
jgi:hypothetical protein